MNLPTATLVILAGIVWVLNPVSAPSLTFEQRWEPVKQLPPMQDRIERPLTFEERWEPVRKMPRMLLMEERDVGPKVVPVRTITIRREDVELPPVIEAVAEAPLPQARPVQQRRTIRKASLDICQRHGMHKQVTRGGKSWRCRR